jgi:GNAT superfamily N-acetyltransferase
MGVREGAVRRTPGEPREESQAEVRVVRLPRERLAEAVGVLSRSYQDHPNFIDFFPAAEVRARALPRVCAAGLRDALALGHVYAALHGGALVGVAAWLPPGGFPPSPWRQLRVAPDLLRVLAAAPRSTGRLRQFMANVARRHPPRPYWYLENVGVEPAMQGRGIGRRLLRPVLALADAAGQPCYLETQTERNVAWYRTLGFEVREAGIAFTAGGPPNWTMLRHPRRR